MRKVNLNILVIEESDIIRNGLVHLLRDKNSAWAINQCGKECIWELAFSKHEPDILIIPPSLLEQNQKSLISIQKKHSFKIVGLIYSYHHPENLKSFDTLIHLNDNGASIQNTIQKMLFAEPQSNFSDNLSKRETEVLKCISTGYPTKQIADRLHISIHTVNAHRKNIMKKLEIKTISGLTIYAVLNNIISIKNY